MDDEIVILGDDGTEHVFPAGFDPKRAAAIVRGDTPRSIPLATTTAGAALTAAKVAPAMVKGANLVSQGIGALAKNRAAKYAPGAVALDAAGRVARGDYKGAATSATTAAAMSQAPRIASAVQRSTNPAITALRGGGGRFITGARPAGGLMRGAGWLSRAASKAALPVTLLSTLADLAQLSRDLEAEARATRPDLPLPEPMGF